MPIFVRGLSTDQMPAVNLNDAGAAPRECVLQVQAGERIQNSRFECSAGCKNLFIRGKADYLADLLPIDIVHELEGLDFEARRNGCRKRTDVCLLLTFWRMNQEYFQCIEHLVLRNRYRLP